MKSNKTLNAEELVSKFDSIADQNNLKEVDSNLSIQADIDGGLTIKIGKLYIVCKVTETASKE